MTTPVDSNLLPEDGQPPLSLATAAARTLATTTKSVPQMQGISSRWLLRLLPWVEVSAGTYRVNRRLTHALGDGRVAFIATGAQVRVIPFELRELPQLRAFEDEDVLSALADRFAQREVAAGGVIVESGQPAEEVVLIAHGRGDKLGTGKYGDPVVLGVLADGDYVGADVLTGQGGTWEFTLRAATACTVLALPVRHIDTGETAAP